MERIVKNLESVLKHHGELWSCTTCEKKLKDAIAVLALTQEPAKAEQTEKVGSADFCTDLKDVAQSLTFVAKGLEDALTLMKPQSRLGCEMREVEVRCAVEDIRAAIAVLLKKGSVKEEKDEAWLTKLGLVSKEFTAPSPAVIALICSTLRVTIAELKGGLEASSPGGDCGLALSGAIADVQQVVDVLASGEGHGSYGHSLQDCIDRVRAEGFLVSRIAT